MEMTGADIHDCVPGGCSECRPKWAGARVPVPRTTTAQKFELVMRPGWDEYFLGVAWAVSLRGDCTRRQVGCVLVDQDHRIIGTGYNGAEPGGPSCRAGQCPRGQKTYEQVAPNTGSYDDCVAIHAEANALLFARTSCKGATAYVTSAVCPGCEKLLRGAGVTRVVTA